MPVYQQVTRILSRFGFAFSTLCAFATVAIASGGSLDVFEVKCTSPSGKNSHIVIRINTATSSERIGEALIYPNKNNLSAMLTSQASCYQYNTLAPDTTLANFEARETLMVCGNLKWKNTRTGTGRKVATIVANKSGYRTLFWETNSGALLARLEKQDAQGAYANVFGENLSCTEVAEQ